MSGNSDTNAECCGDPHCSACMDKCLNKAGNCLCMPPVLCFVFCLPLAVWSWYACTCECDKVKKGPQWNVPP